MDKVLKNHKTKDQYDILNLLMQSTHGDNAHLSQEEVFANMMILFVAGHETTSSALSWLLLELTQHPEIQEKMYKEIMSVIGNNEPTFETVNSLEYVDRVINENMRIHPSVPLLFTRKAVTDLQYKDMWIPKDSAIGFSAHAIHRDPNHWENPEVFDPERFSPEKVKGRHKFAFIPFSLGPRMCLGNNFSLVEQRLFIAQLLKQFEVVKPQSHKHT